MNEAGPLNAVIAPGRSEKGWLPGLPGGSLPGLYHIPLNALNPYTELQDSES